MENHYQSDWLKGVWQAGPIVLGYIPVGFTFGVLAMKSGISWFNTVGMSLLVYGGASQFIAVGLMAVQAPAMTIILTTFAVNLRHLIMSSALAPHLDKWRTWQLAAFTYELTDEAFALHSLDFAQTPPDKPTVFAVNMTAHAAWLAGTGLGAAAGTLIGDVKPYALDYALPALFAALVILQIKNRSQIVVALISGLLAVGFLLGGLKQWYMIAAAVIGATCGVLMESWIKKQSS